MRTPLHLIYIDREDIMDFLRFLGEMWPTIYGIRYELQKFKNIIGRLAFIKDNSGVGLMPVSSLS